jgi:hypothetical protein
MRTSLLWIQPHLFVGVGVRLDFGLQESTYVQQLSQLHMDSNLGVLLLHGKITKSTLRWIQPHVDTLSESVTIIDFIQRCILSMVSLFLYTFIDDSENRLLPNNVMMIRNYGEDWNGLKRDVEGQRSSKGGEAKLVSQSKSSWNPIRIPRTVGNKIIAQITYQLYFGRSLYVWKAKRIKFPMELVTHPNSF